MGFVQKATYTFIRLLGSTEVEWPKPRDRFAILTTVPTGMEPVQVISVNYNNNTVVFGQELFSINKMLT